MNVLSQYGGGQTETGKVFVPPGTETFTHDADGNLTGDGRWTYNWDAENRLVQMIRDSDSPSGARQKLVFEYDHQVRRIRKQYFVGSYWQGQTDTIFLYDGWNLVAELNANASNARVRTYVWGSDLAGSMQGAGGVGGLLKPTYYGTSTTNAFVAYDGNGNVTALIDAANGNVCARYEYGPFAEPIRSSGPLSKLNPIRFSTKYTDNESGFLYYGYRYYNPSTGRWLSRDPLRQPNYLLYVFAANDPLSKHDYRGLFTQSFVAGSPKWQPDSEDFWAGIVFKLDPISSEPVPPIPFTVIARHHAFIQVTPCSASGQTRDSSSARWFAAHISVQHNGRIAGGRSGMDETGWWGFELGWLGYSAPSAYGFMGGKTGPPTSGLYQTDLLLIVFPGNIDVPPAGASLPSDWLHSENKHHQGWTMLNDYPADMSSQPYAFAFTSLIFSWDNCCGHKWHFSCSSDPSIGQGGPHIFKGHSLPGSVYLLDQPTNP